MRITSKRCRGASGARGGRIVTLALFVLGAAGVGVAAGPTKSWTDADLVASYRDLAADGSLEEAVRNPARPSEPPSAAFLEALAWFAARTPDSSGTLTLDDLDEFLGNQVGLYQDYLVAKVEEGVDNDYSRTRTWKVVQKLMLLRDQMIPPAGAGSYRYSAMPKATSAGDPWERAHIVRSKDDFLEKVCRGSRERPVLVKFGNTNCTQCMLFELTGSIQELAENSQFRDSVDVYKVWWGLRPDSTFAGRIRNPELLNELAVAEGVHSSPYFIVYRDGRRYPCGDAFPDAEGSDEHLEACVALAGSEAPMADVCAVEAS